MPLPASSSRLVIPLILILSGGLLSYIAVAQMGHAFPEALHRHSWQYRDNIIWVYLFLFGIAGIGGGMILAIRSINKERKASKKD